MVESFKSTLDEVREADLLLHVVDISHSNFEEHIASVNKILGEIKSNDKPTIMVFNKIDAIIQLLMIKKIKANYSIEDWEKTWMRKLGNVLLFLL